MPSEQAELAQRVLFARATGGFVSEHDAFQLRFYARPDEALLPLDEIARLILQRDHGRQSARAGEGSS